MAGNTADDLVTVQQRARNLGIGCSKRSREHELSYQFWNLVSTVTTLVIALFSGLAGTALLAQAPTGSALAWIAGALGATATLLAALDAKLGSSAKAEAHGRAFAAFAGIRTSYYDLATLGRGRPGTSSP